jgi:hypothetical protein
MKLLAGALLTVAIGWAVVLAAPKPVRRPRLAKPARIETAEQICKAQGPTCRVVVRPETPRDLTGVGCECK